MGPNKGSINGLHFNTTHLQQIGAAFCRTLVDYVENPERVARVYNELKQRFPNGQAGSHNAVAARPSVKYNNKTDEEKDF